MATSPNRIALSRNQQILMLQKLIDGLKKHEQGIALLIILGQSMKVTDIIALLQPRLDSITTVTTTRATWQKAVKADRDEQQKTRAFVTALRQTLLAAFANQLDVLADVGLVARKPVVVSPETRVAAIAKAKATRAARHTMGKKQKASIQGDVDGVTIVPHSASSPVDPKPVTPTAPAPSTGAAATPSQSSALAATPHVS